MLNENSYRFKELITNFIDNPAPFFSTDGGWQGIQIIFFVDLVLGPCLTLIIFNPNKKTREKIFDLSIIALVQSAALVWGVHTVYHERPVVISHSQGAFYSVDSEALEVQNVQLSALKPLSKEAIPIVSINANQTPDDLKESLLLSFNHSLPVAAHFHLFRPLKESMDDLMKYALNIQAVAADNADIKQGLQELIKAKNIKIEESIFMPFKGRYGNAILVFSHQGDYIGYIKTDMDY